MSLDAMKQALEALQESAFYLASEYTCVEKECEAAITALRAAIEQAQEWQGLTPSEITAIELSLRQYHDGDRYDLSLADFANAIEAKLKAKNA